MTTAELMAIAVLKGDLAAARALADHLLEDVRDGGIPLPPVTKLHVPAGRLKAVVYMGEKSAVSAAREAWAAVLRWLEGDAAVLVLKGVDRIDLYQFQAGEGGA